MGAPESGFKYSGCHGAAFPTRLDLDFRFPWPACAAVAAMATATLAVAWATPMAPALRIALVVAIAVDALWAACAVLRTAGLRIDRSGRIEVTSRDGRILHGRVQQGSFVAPWFTTVRWRPEGSRFSRTIALLPGMLSAVQFRHLRVLLKWA